MSNHAVRQLEKRQRASESVCNIFANAERFRWTRTKILECLRDFYRSPDYMGMPQYMQSYIQGQVDLLFKQLGKKTESAYFIKGEYLLITSKKYQSISPQTVYRKYTDNYARVWKEDPTVAYAGYGADEE